MGKVSKVNVVRAIALVAIGCGLGVTCFAASAAETDSYKAGVEYQQQGKWEDAISAFKSIVNRGDLAGDISIRIADCYVHVNMPRAAVEELKSEWQALKQKPESAKEVILRLLEFAPKSKQYDDMIEAYNYLCLADSNAAPTYACRIVDCLVSKGDFDAAITACDRIISRYEDTDSAKYAYFQKAESFKAKKDVDNAVRAYLTCGQDFPDEMGNCVVQASLCYPVIDGATEAIVLLRKRLASAPNDPFYQKLSVALADRYLEIEADAAAEKTYQAGIAATENDPAVARELVEKLARYYLKAKEPNKASAIYNTAISTHADQAANYRHDEVHAFVDLGYTDLAILATQEAVRNAQTPEIAKDAIIWCADRLVDIGKVTEGVDYLKQAQIDHPDFSREIIVARTIIRRKYTRQYAEIVGDYQQLINLYPDSESVPEWKIGMAEVTLYFVHDQSAARRILNEFIASYPGDQRLIIAKNHIAMISFQNGDYRNAVLLFNEALSCPEFGNYRASILSQMAACHRLMGESEWLKVTLDMLFGAYPDDCWAKFELKNSTSATSGP